MTATQLAMPGLARRTDPATSHAAARRAPGWEARIRAAFAERDFGMTDDELCRILAVEPRQWPTVKTARSRVTRCSTGLVRDGQTVWTLKVSPLRR